MEGILKVAKDTLDSGAYSEYFKFVIEQCCPHLSDFYQNANVAAENPERVIGWESCSSKVPLESITLDNLPQYYGCEIEGFNYSSISVWKDLIHAELNENDELTLLYDMLEKNYFPSSNWTKMNHCFHTITAVLISNPKTNGYWVDVSYGETDLHFSDNTRHQTMKTTSFEMGYDRTVTLPYLNDGFFSVSANVARSDITIDRAEGEIDQWGLNAYVGGITSDNYRLLFGAHYQQGQSEYPLRCCPQQCRSAME